MLHGTSSRRVEHAGGHCLAERPDWSARIGGASESKHQGLGGLPRESAQLDTDSLVRRASSTAAADRNACGVMPRLQRARARRRRSAAAKFRSYPLPFPLPSRGVIRGILGMFSPDGRDEQSSENTEKSRYVTVVAPTGFEPVF